jgi:hypothetical protein
MLRRLRVEFEVICNVVRHVAIETDTTRNGSAVEHLFGFGDGRYDHDVIGVVACVDTERRLVQVNVTERASPVEGVRRVAVHQASPLDLTRVG